MAINQYLIVFKLRFSLHKKQDFWQQNQASHQNTWLLPAWWNQVISDWSFKFFNQACLFCHPEESEWVQLKYPMKTRVA